MSEPNDVVHDEDTLATVLADVQHEILSEDVTANPQEDWHVSKLVKPASPPPQNFTPLQKRYIEQLDDSARQAILPDMDRCVAWTWLPGKYRKDCPELIDLREPRLLVMDRYPDRVGQPCEHIALSLYAVSVDRSQPISQIVFGGPSNMQMFKDFSLQPYFHAGGLCLDSENEDVFRAALALDQAIELTARGKLAPVDTFTPPTILFGFPKHYVPVPDWQALQVVVRQRLHPSSPVMRCLLSPGAIVRDISIRNNIRSIKLEREGNTIQVNIPVGLPLAYATRLGNTVADGQPLADLPRKDYATIKEMEETVPFPLIEWLERRCLDELTELVTVEEEVIDRNTSQRKKRQTTWRCVPYPFAQNQGDRAVRFFLNMKNHLGRKIYSMDNQSRDTWTEDSTKARIDVIQLPAVPSYKDLRFSGERDDSGAWYADFITQPRFAPWANKCSARGYLEEGDPGVSSAELDSEDNFYDGSFTSEA